MRTKLLTTLLLGMLATGCAKRMPPVALETLVKEPAAQEIPAKQSRAYALIDKSEQQFYIMEDQRVVRTYAIATGKNSGDKQSVDDCRTPEGEFILAEPVNSSHWKYEGALAYGPYFFRVLGTEWKGIGLHGTKGSVGRPKSHGCIRMKTQDLLEFKTRHYHENMPLVIRE